MRKTNRSSDIHDAASRNEVIVLFNDNLTQREIGSRVSICHLLCRLFSSFSRNSVHDNHYGPRTECDSRT